MFKITQAPMQFTYTAENGKYYQRVTWYACEQGKTEVTKAEYEKAKNYAN